MIWVYGVCKCPFYGTLGVNGLTLSLQELALFIIVAFFEHILKSFSASNVILFINNKLSGFFYLYQEVTTPHPFTIVKYETTCPTPFCPSKPVCVGAGVGAGGGEKWGGVVTS